MSKKSPYQSMSYKKELINSLGQNFIFGNKPINRFKINETNIKKNNLNKIGQITELKKLINSIQNCNLKDNSKNMILGDGNLDSSIMIIGEAPGPEEEKTNMTFQGEAGALLKKRSGISEVKLLEKIRVILETPDIKRKAWKARSQEQALATY